jgi:hypothetical protein
MHWNGISGIINMEGGKLGLAGLLGTKTCISAHSVRTKSLPGFNKQSMFFTK